MTREKNIPLTSKLPADRLSSITDRIPLSVWMITPAEAVLLFLLIVPTLVSIFLSFTTWQPTVGYPWFEASMVGFDNYISLLSDGTFLYSLALTVGVVITAVTAEFLIGFGLALLCQGEFPGRKLFVLLLLTPMMVMPVVAGNMFSILFRQGGPINAILSLLAGSTVEIAWLSSFPAALVPIFAAEIWHWYPLLFLILYSGLNALPEDQIQAAETLGASPLQIFRLISLPALKPVILIGVVIRAMGAIKMFDIVFLLTSGGPGNSTEIISIYLYKQTFEFFNIAFASAAAWIIFIASIVVFVLALRPLLYETEIYEEEGENL
jgi:multiple sugar transport system permease protein